MKIVCVRIEDDILEKIDVIARERLKTRSEMIRAILRQYVNNVESGEKPFVSRRMRIW